MNVYYLRNSGTCPNSSQRNNCDNGKQLCSERFVTIPSGTVLTKSEARSKLDTGSLPTGPVIRELVNHGSAPDADPTPTVSGPASSPGPTSTTAQPNGDIVSTATTYNYTYQGDTINTTETTTQHVTNNSTGTTDTTITESAPPEDNRTDCEKNPNNIGCSQYGDAPTPDTLQTQNAPTDMTVNSWGSGSCPPPIILSLSFGAREFSLQPLCNFMTAMYWVVIAVAWLSAGYIVLGGVKD